jgi:hypothetical protein
MRYAYCALHGLRDRAFRSAGEFVDAIEHYVAVPNKDPKPFVWTTKANEILQNVIRANSKLSSEQDEALH